MTRLLFEQVALAWQAFDRVAGWPCRVTPAAPILFFGDLPAYRDAPLRVLTVGLNPSLHEFPAGVRIPVKVITCSTPNVITDSTESDRLTERSDAGVRL